MMLAVLASGAAPPPLLAQQGARPEAPASRMAELLHRRDLRDAQAGGDAQKIAGQARGYLEKFPQGRYRDEALLALAQALSQSGQSSEALGTYDRLIENHPGSPFREQAIADSLPLLQAAGDEAGAFARLEQLLNEYPRSVMRGSALMWRARIHSERKEFPDTVKTLRRLRPERELSGRTATEYYRLLVVASTHSAQPAWKPLQKYLNRPDTAQNKARVLMLVADAARQGGRNGEAFGYYRLVAEDYPDPGQLPEALFWRAELFAAAKLPAAQDKRRAAALETGIGYYSAYLAHGDTTHAGAAHLGRARLHQSAGRNAEALGDYEQAIARRPELKDDLEIALARIALYKAQGQREPARVLIAGIRERQELEPARRTALLLELAALHYEDRQCGQVEALLQPMPDLTDAAQGRRAAFIRGFCRHLLGHWERAAFDLEGLVEHPDYQALALPPLLTVYEKSGQPSRLVKLVETLLRENRLEPSREVFVRVARAYGALGEWVRLKTLHQRLQARNAGELDHPEVRYHLGRAERALKNPDAAIAHQEAAWQQLKETENGAGSLLLAVLGELQTLYVAEKRFDFAQGLHDEAAALLTGAPHKEQAAALNRQLWTEWGREAIRQGDSALALEKLNASLARHPAAGGPERQRVVAVMIAAHLKSESPEQALVVYRREAPPEAGPVRREALTLTVLEEAGNLQADRPEPPQRPQVIAFYRAALDGLPPDNGGKRYEVLLVLDRLHAEAGEYPARLKLVEDYRRQSPDGKTRETLRLHQSRVHREWGRRLMNEKQHAQAAGQLLAALQVLRPEEWRERFEATSLLSRAYLAERKYTELVLLNEAELANIPDEKLAGQVNHFLGQVYLDWGKAADQGKNIKSARIRYHRALDYLPESDWQRRLAAANGLSAALRKLNQPRQAAEILEQVVPQIKNPLHAQQYALYLGRLYLQTLKDPVKGQEWLMQGDQGGNDPLSLESGYLLSGQEIEARQTQAAISRLEALTERQLNGSDWEVPIHYRLAVLLHREKELKEALRHYRIVSQVDDAKIKRTYPRAIAQSADKTRQIEAFLKSSGGGGGAKIAIPKVR